MTHPSRVVWLHRRMEMARNRVWIIESRVPGFTRLRRWSVDHHRFSYATRAMARVVVSKLNEEAERFEYRTVPYTREEARNGN